VKQVCSNPKNQGFALKQIAMYLVNSALTPLNSVAKAVSMDITSLNKILASHV
jgi:hypothetical protein